MASCEILSASELINRKFNDCIIKRRFTERSNLDESECEWDLYDDECELYGFAQELQSLDSGLWQLPGKSNTEILSASELINRKFNDCIIKRRFTERLNLDESECEWDLYDDECELYGFAQELQSLESGLRQLPGKSNTEYNSLLPHDEERFTAGGAYGKAEASIADHGVAAQTMVASVSLSDVEMTCKKFLESIRNIKFGDQPVEMAYKNIIGLIISDGQRVKMACEKIFGSILNIKFEARSKADVKAYIKNLIKKLSKVKKDEWRKKMDEILETNTTGFVVGEDQSHLFVLTCAHSFEACFNVSNPISVATLENLFKVSVWCDHDELNHDKSVPRDYRYVEVLNVDSRKDILLLKVKKQGFCTQNHMVLKMTNNLHPRHLEDVGMVSWPLDRHRTTMMGKISNNCRDQQAVYEQDLHGYDFSAIEVDIAAEAGSSGAPLVDKECEVIGMLHGGRGESVNYFVSSSEIYNKLTILGIINEAGPSASGNNSGTRRKRKLQQEEEASTRLGHVSGDNSRKRKHKLSRKRKRNLE